MTLNIDLNLSHINHMQIFSSILVHICGNTVRQDFWKR